MKVVDFEALQGLTGYRRRSDVERALREQGIRVFWGRRGPWTTVDLINQAGGLSLTGNTDGYSADVI